MNRIMWIIRATPGPSVVIEGCDLSVSLGTIIPYAGDEPPAGWLVCDGGWVRIEDFPALYAILGNTYGPAPTITREMEPGRWEKVRRAIGLLPRRRYEHVPNPEHRPGYFRLPHPFPITRSEVAA